MEMPLQQGDWEGEKLCLSECVSQTALAVAVRVAFAARGSEWGEGALHMSLWGGCDSVSPGWQNCMSVYLQWLCVCSYGDGRMSAWGGCAGGYACGQVPVCLSVCPCVSVCGGCVCVCLLVVAGCLLCRSVMPGWCVCLDCVWAWVGCVCESE